MTFTKYIKKIWKFLKADTWQSWLVSIVLVVIFIKFIFFPSISFLTGSSLPLVIIESCSLYHESDFNEWWDKNSAWYESRNITKSEFELFSFKNGLNKGDILLIIGREKYEKGDIIVFDPNPESSAKHPIIHRIVTKEPYGTKGDHNTNQLTINNNIYRTDETNIPKDNIIGKAALRIQFLGWVKLIFFEPFRPKDQKGFCK